MTTFNALFAFASALFAAALYVFDFPIPALMWAYVSGLYTMLAVMK
jgi:hypothetical protein